MNAVFYTTSNTGSVGVGIGSSSSQQYVTSSRKFTASIPESEFSTSNEVTLVIDNSISRTFSVKPGQTFFVIIQKESQGERYVTE